MVKKGAGGETLCINPWYVAALGRNSKQVFAGTTRIATKLEQFPSGEGYGTGAKNLTEVYQYFYRQDHLGSTGFVTDATGEVYQHLEYFPFGETWVDEVSDDTRVPYRFTGQEFDEETKLYYHGARYYDPRTSAWESADPALGTHAGTGKAGLVMPSLATGWKSHLAGSGMGGMFEPTNMNLYTYAGNNPIVRTDPTGMDYVDCDIEFSGNVATGGGCALTVTDIPRTWINWNFTHHHMRADGGDDPTYEHLSSPTYQGHYDFIVERFINEALTNFGLKFERQDPPSLWERLATAVGIVTPEFNRLKGQWSKGTFEDVEQSLDYHVKKWGEGGDTLKYLRQAEGFGQNLKGARRVPLANGATRYEKAGKFLIKDAEGKNLSFGKITD